MKVPSGQFKSMCQSKKKKPEGVLTVSHSRVDVRALALPTGLFPLLITDFAFCTLVAEDLNLAV